MADVERLNPGILEDYKGELLIEAESICLEGLRRDPCDPAFLNLRGLLAMREGRFELACICLNRALDLAPADAQYAIDLGRALARADRHLDAEQAFRHAIGLDAQQSEAHRELARVLLHQRRLVEALATYEQVVQLDPASAGVHGELGDILQALGQRDDALIHYERAIELDPSDPDACRRLGRARLGQADLPAAMAILQQGLRAQPRRPDLHVALGEALLRLGRTDEAIASIRTALLFAPRDVAACRQLALALELAGRRQDAAEAWFCFGIALERQDRLREAAVAHRQALQRKRDHLNAHVALGRVHLALADPRTAIPYFRAALDIEPRHDEAHRGLGHASALTGDLTRTWEEFAWFDRYGPWMRRHFNEPAWDGSPLNGRRILLWTNTGPGETIQLIRFARLAKERGGHVIVECHRSLAPLVRRMSGVDRVIPRKTPLPGFDVQALLASLPRIFQIGHATIPSETPYLSVDSQLVNTWREGLSVSLQPTVGLAWANETSEAQGQDGRRGSSAPLAIFAPLAGVSGVRFVSLQLGPRAAELLTAPPGLEIEDPLADSATLADVAALTSHLDLIISVDNTIAHLAGALAKPVWTLLPFAPTWSWSLDDQVSVWYPTMRLFRQTQPHDWRSPVTRVVDALIAFRGSHATKRQTIP